MCVHVCGSKRLRDLAGCNFVSLYLQFYLFYVLCNAWLNSSYFVICSILFLLQFWILFDLRFSLSLCTADWLIDLRFSCNLLSCVGWTFVFLWYVWLNSNCFELDLFVILNVFWPVVFFAFFAFVYCWLINRSALFLQFVFLCMLDICFLMLYVVKFKLFCAWWLVCNCNFECFLTWFLFFAFFAFACCWLIALLFHCLRAISVFVFPLLEYHTSVFWNSYLRFRTRICVLELVSVFANERQPSAEI